MTYDLVVKGDLQGHEFRGNQWTEGGNDRLAHDVVSRDQLISLRVFSGIRERILDDSIFFEFRANGLNGESGLHSRAIGGNYQRELDEDASHQGREAPQPWQPGRIVVNSDLPKEDSLFVTIGEHKTSAESVQHTVRHEYGHVFQDRGLSSNEYLSWKLLYQSKTKGEWDKLVSRYGAEDDKELFAESFAAWTHPGYREGQLPVEIERFMTSTVGRRGKQGDKSIALNLYRKSSTSISALDPKKWRKKLVDACLPALAVGMAKAMAGEMASLGVDVRRGGRPKGRKGDIEGHPFRGNQWTEGQGGDETELARHVSMFGDDTVVRKREICTSEIKRLGRISRKVLKQDVDLEAVRQYTDAKGDLFRSMNEHLRSGFGLTDVEIQVDGTLHRLCQTELEKPSAVYRGVQLEGKDYDVFISQCKETANSGGTVQFNSYTSASLSASQANIFAVAPQSEEDLHSGNKKMPVMMEIVAKRGLYLTREVTAKPEELELVMDKNAKYRVLGVSEGVLYRSGGKERGFTVIRLEQDN